MWLQYLLLNKNWKIVLVKEIELENYVPASAVKHKIQVNLISWKAFKKFLDKTKKIHR